MYRRTPLLLAALVPVCALDGCGPPPQANSETTTIATPATAQPLQDQRIDLAPLGVGDAETLPPKDPRPEPGDSSSIPLHSEEQLGRVASDGAHDVRICVEAAESKSKTLGITGDLVVHLEIDAAGLVLGGTTNPRGGEAGLAAVADCVLKAARQWRFPSRATPGSTVLVVPYRID